MSEEEKKDKKFHNITLTQEMHSKVSIVSAMKGMNMREWIRTAIQEKLERDCPKVEEAMLLLK